MRKNSILTFILLHSEPLRRGDLLNAINKLAGEKAVSKLRRKHRPAIVDALPLTR
jgi:osomolarity two-component system sensor histidine kinase NIK1